MLNCCIQFCLVLFALVVQKYCAQVCTAGWFGNECRYPCRCETSVECDVEGVCPNNERCRSPYFGPGCQYIDLAITSSVNTTPWYLRDNDETTCNPNSSDTRVTVTLNHPIWARWFRIHTNENKNNSTVDYSYPISLVTLFHRNFTTTIDQIPCDRLKQYRVHNTAMDLRCVTRNNFRHIEFQGRVVGHICTINISGGRNVAIHQSVRQSSDFSGISIDLVKAENAVDDNTNSDSQAGSCSLTDVETSEATWTLMFNGKFWIQKIVIYNSETYRDWLPAFSVRTFNSFGMLNWRYTDNSPQIQRVYEIEVNIGEKVTMIEITAPRNTQGQSVLSLCEVQVLGDAACRPMMYGQACEKQCSCDLYVRCSRVNGACEYTKLYNCPPGTYGEYCNASCPDNCRYGACDAQTGHCLLCLPGFTGDVCNTVCSPGTFGLNCSLNCSSHCDDFCHHITGLCLCRDGSTGSLCTECPVGLYGFNCSRTCPVRCYMNRCDVRTGECDTCPDRRTGFSCEDCVPGWYGPECQESCSFTCYNRRCNQSTGKCLSCSDKHTGPDCKECVNGWYSEECNETCPNSCEHPVCNKTTGDCKSCFGNLTGPKCEDCPTGYYGSACSIRCPRHCREGSCHSVDGSCHSCAEGFSGIYCQTGSTPTDTSNFLLPILIGVMAVVFFCCVTLARHRPYGE